MEIRVASHYEVTLYVITPHTFSGPSERLVFAASLSCLHLASDSRAAGFNKEK